MAESHRLKARELEGMQRDGFVLRRSVFDESELRRMREACEQLVEDLLAAKRRTKLAVGSYMFELQRQLGTVVKWEPANPDLVQGVELFAHLSSDLKRWALDPRFVEPSKDVCGIDQVIMFTEKLNVK